MDSPETSKITSSTGLDSSPVQDSPFFNFISNLSPIKPVKSSAHVAHELTALSSPPIVFKTPRTKQPSETSVLKRSQSLQLSTAEATQNITGGKDSIDGSVDSEQFITECQSGLITENQRDCNVDEFFETHPSSSSGCVDEFLADPGGADCVNSAYSATPSSKKSNDAYESSQSGSKETTLELDDRNGAGRDAGTEQAEKTIQGEPKFDGKSIGIREQRDAEWSSHECLNIETNLHVGAEEDCQNSQAQGRERRHQNNYESISQPSAEPFHFQIYKDISEDEDVREFSDGLAESIMLRGDQGSEDQRGMRRRCLQFEEAPRHTTGYSDSPLNLANTVNSLKLSTSDIGLENFKCHVELKENCDRQIVNLPQSTAPLLHPRSSEKFQMVSKPLGIGLHLNSIVNAASVGCTANSGKKSTDHDMDVQRTKSGMASNNLAENTQNCSMSSSAAEKDSASNEERAGIIKSSIVPSSVPNDNMGNQFAAPDETGKSDSQNADSLEERDQLSPRKKRKKTKSTGGRDGCKRCNCKKTKCLKLYCDCFAAGVYCMDPCSCQGCFNKPEHKKTVVETREQIESRNPLAFAPKIVQRIPELPPNHVQEDGNRSTPSSARHKRGCNCKKSMCLKKYCECYQANVGCSSGCRCEGCKNVYGRKEEYAAVEHGITGIRACTEKLESTFDKESEMVESKRDLLSTELITPHNLTPLTPSFQYSDHGKDAPKSRFLSRRYRPSPDSDLSFLSSNEKTKSPPRDSGKRDVLLEASEELLDDGSYDGQADNNIGIVDSTSSRRDSVPNMPHLTQHPDTSMPMISSTSFRRRDCRNASQNQLHPGSNRLSSNSMHRHGSPLTPMTRLGGEAKSRQALVSGSVQLVDILEDETTVKVSSPNKKRVSPPHSHIFELGSGSSGKLKSGRKFILKSVPSFPPLTPCIDSKRSNSENTDELQENSGRSQNVTVNP